MSIAVVGCDPALAREAQRITAIELHAAVVDLPSAEVGTEISAACGEKAANLKVLDRATGKSLERSVALSQAAPSARARLLALALAELVVTSWSELESNAAPRAAPPRTVAPQATHEEAPSAAAGLPIELAAVIDAHLLASRDLILGGGARGEIWVSSHLFVRLDGLTHYAELSRPNGVVTLTMPSFSSALGISFGHSWLEPRLSLGVRAGYVWLSGGARSAAVIGTRQQGAWAGPELAFELTGNAKARIHPLLSFSAGAHVFGVRGTVDGGPDISVAGLWSSLSLGVALR